jgi:UDP-N-acetylmuramate dehydrogenase
MPWLWKLERLFPFRLQRDIPLAEKTSLGVGGPAQAYLEAKSPDDLVRVADFALNEGVPLWIIGGGTNILVHDDGLDGIVLSTLGLTGLKWQTVRDSIQIIAESGVLLSRLVKLSGQMGWTGLEFATGIPGTVGGALAGNAGTEGKGLCDLLEWAKTTEIGGASRIRQKGELAFSYRRSCLSDDKTMILSCCLNLRQSTSETVRSAMEYFRQKRKMQPRKAKTAGCVFKNPDTGISAGKLLDLSGCKELRTGGAKVSGIHANFLEVGRGAVARDVYELIAECRRRVYAQFGIWLELEIRLFGGPWGKW